MEFFKTADGRVHAGRVAGVIFLLALLIDHHGILALEPLHVSRVICAVGWWLTFGQKARARSFREMMRFPSLLGSILILLGLAGQQYFLRSHSV